MATSNSVGCSRIPLLLLSAAAVIWSALVLPCFWASGLAKDISVQILAGDRFKLGRANEMLAVMQARSIPRPIRSDLVRAEALLWTRVAEESLGRRRSDEVDRNLEAADDQLKSALKRNPGDSVLWLMLYSLETSRNGFDERTVGLLRQSYAMGPREGWIALQRNSIALSGFSVMTAAVQDQVISEFSNLVDSNFGEAAAVNLTSVGWEQRERLLAALSNTNAAARETFARRLARDGIKVTVPGVELDERFRR